MDDFNLWAYIDPIKLGAVIAALIVGWWYSE